MKVIIEFHPRDLSDEDRAVLRRIIGDDFVAVGGGRSTTFPVPQGLPLEGVEVCADDDEPIRAGGTSSEDEEPGPEPLHRSDVRLMVGDRIKIEDHFGKVTLDIGDGDVLIKMDDATDHRCRYLNGRFCATRPCALDVSEVNGRPIVED